MISGIDNRATGSPEESPRGYTDLLLRSYTTHEDSVYSRQSLKNQNTEDVMHYYFLLPCWLTLGMAWVSREPCIFASLSYDGGVNDEQPHNTIMSKQITYLLNEWNTNNYRKSKFFKEKKALHYFHPCMVILMKTTFCVSYLSQFYVPLCTYSLFVCCKLLELQLIIHI